MLWTNVNSVDIHTILEPSLLLTDFNIITTHVPLLHQAIFIESPVLKSVASPPLTIVIMKFIPELYSNLIYELTQDALMRFIRTSRSAHLIIVESKELLSQLVLMFAIPLIS